MEMEGLLCQIMDEAYHVGCIQQLGNQLLKLFCVFFMQEVNLEEKIVAIRYFYDIIVSLSKETSFRYREVSMGLVLASSMRCQAN